MIRVGVILQHGLNGWHGGISYFRNLKIGVAAMAARDVQLELFGPDFLPAELLTAPAPGMTRPGGAQWFARMAIRTITGTDYLLDRWLRRYDIDVLTHSPVLGKSAKTPAIAWIPDFQHLHLPEFFSAGERRQRDRAFRGVAEKAALVVLSSKAAMADYARAFPGHAAKARVLQFADFSAVQTTEARRREVRQRYGLGGPFFLVANQFWRHKNHLAIVEALSMAQERGRGYTVVATGRLEDSRKLGDHNELFNRIADLGAGGPFRALGPIPYDDLCALLDECVALINPSLFEGWNTAVEEAKARGKLVLLSDLPVHREQAPARAKYFEPRSAEELLNHMESAQQEYEGSLEAERMAKAAASYPEARARFVRQFVAVVGEAAQKETMGPVLQGEPRVKHI